LIGGPVAVLSMLLPPILVHRGLSAARRGGTLSAWWYSVIRKPLAERVVGWLGGGPSPLPRALPADAPTEVLLGQAAEQILARLPQAAREQLPALPAAAAALAAEAATLRARAQALSGEQRELRTAAPSPAHDATRLALADEQDRVQQRLGTTIAALEAIRLDLLRLEASQTQPGVLTEQLDVLHDLQRHVDAVQELRRLLQDPTPTPG
jgi:eukaryotic-like serine/threonine-protein kinase